MNQGKNAVLVAKIWNPNLNQSENFGLVGLLLQVFKFKQSENAVLASKIWDPIGLLLQIHSVNAVHVYKIWDPWAATGSWTTIPRRLTGLMHR